MNKDTTEERIGQLLKLSAMDSTPPTIQRVRARLEKRRMRWGSAFSVAIAAALGIVVLILVIGWRLQGGTGVPAVLSIELRTQEPVPSGSTPQPCAAAQTSGQLARGDAGRLVLVEPYGLRRPVIWPFGYSARENEGRIEVLDEHGRVVAMEGDRVLLAGGEIGSDGPWSACGPPKIL